MNIGPWQIAIIAILILVLFGRGRISEMMGDFGKGIKSFKKGLNEDDAPKSDPAQIEGSSEQSSASTSETASADKTSN